MSKIGGDMSETTTAVAETATAIAGKTATATGVSVSLISWAAALDWGFLIGVGIGVIGLLISFLNYLSNRQYQKRKDAREAEMHQLESEVKRLTVKSLEGLCNVEQD